MLACICHMAAAVFFTLGMIRWALEPYREQLNRQNDRMKAMLYLVSRLTLVNIQSDAPQAWSF